MNIPCHASRFTLLLLLAGCATKPPPDSTDIRNQALTNVTLPPVWKAGRASVPASQRTITDYWLATFKDPQLDALVREAIASNPDLRVTATKVEQAAHYVQLAQAALRPSIGIAGTGGIKAGGGGDVTSALQGIMIAA